MIYFCTRPVWTFREWKTEARASPAPFVELEDGSGRGVGVITQGPCEMWKRNAAAARFRGLRDW